MDVGGHQCIHLLQRLVGNPLHMATHYVYIYLWFDWTAHSHFHCIIHLITFFFWIFSFHDRKLLSKGFLSISTWFWGFIIQKRCPQQLCTSHYHLVQFLLWLKMTQIHITFLINETSGNIISLLECNRFII